MLSWGIDVAIEWPNTHANTADFLPPNIFVYFFHQDNSFLSFVKEMPLQGVPLQQYPCQSICKSRSPQKTHGEFWAFFIFLNKYNDVWATHKLTKIGIFISSFLSGGLLSCCESIMALLACVFLLITIMIRLFHNDSDRLVGFLIQLFSSKSGPPLYWGDLLTPIRWKWVRLIDFSERTTMSINLILYWYF